MRSVYLDYNGSAPLDPRVAEIMVPILMEGIGNASSIHHFGRRQSVVVDEAREHVGAMVGGRPSNVVFTAGATESNNLALQGAVEGAPDSRPRMLISAVEHASVRQTARWLNEHGLTKLGVIPVTKGGFVDLDALESMIATNRISIAYPLLTYCLYYVLRIDFQPENLSVSVSQADSLYSERIHANLRRLCSVATSDV